MYNIIAKMRSVWPVSDKTFEELERHLKFHVFPKKYKLIKAGERCRDAYFVNSGITRSYWMVDGKEITTSFSEEGGIVFSMDEFYYNRTSEEYVESLEPIEAYSISIEVLNKLFAENIELSNWGRIIHQNEYRRLHRSHKERLTLSAKERYESFKQQFPVVCKRAPLKFIASYLGITPYTLSRLRKL